MAEKEICNLGNLQFESHSEDNLISKFHQLHRDNHSSTRQKFPISHTGRSVCNITSDAIKGGNEDKFAPNDKKTDFGQSSSTNRTENEDDMTKGTETTSAFVGSSNDLGVKTRGQVDRQDKKLRTKRTKEQIAVRPGVLLGNKACDTRMSLGQDVQTFTPPKDFPKLQHEAHKQRRKRNTDSSKVHWSLPVGDKGQTAETLYDDIDGLESFRNQLSEGIRQVQTIYCGKSDPFFDDEWTRKRSMEHIAVAAQFLKQHKVYHYSPLQELYRSQPSERVYHEIYRLSTFATLKNTEVSLIRLAQNGFHYEETKDEIVCFSCGLKKKDWIPGEKAVANRHLQLSPNCKLPFGEDSRDVPINPSRKVMSHTSSSVRQKTSSSSGTSSHETPSGNRGSSQVAQPSPSSQPEEHTRRNAVANGLTPSAGFVAQTAIGSEHHDGLSTSASANSSATQPRLTTLNLAEDGEQQGPVQPEQAPNAFPNELTISASGGDPSHRRDDRGPAGEPRQLAERETPAGLDMRQAVTPEFQSFQSRQNSFASWPLGDLPKPRDLVPAGFYYLGVADSVRCFYCGVTLKNWRGNDDVWETHVRFRFSCAYVKAIKGEDYVILTQIKLSGANSVTVPNNQQALSGSATSGHQPTQGEARNAEAGNTRRPADSPPRQTNDPRTPRSSQQTGREQRSLPASTTQTPQSTQRQQSSRSPTATQSSQHRQNSRSPPAAAAQPSQARTRSSPEPRTSRRSGEVTINGQDVTDTLQELTDTNSQLRAQRTCRECKERSVDTIFLPCGHLCTCEVCAATMRDCCLCRDKIMGTAHVFLE